MQANLGNNMHIEQEKRLNRGFSLLELLMVLAMIGILAGIGFPQFQAWRERVAMTAATSSLMMHLKQARVLASTASRDVKVSWTASSYTFDVGGDHQLTVDLKTFSNKIVLTGPAAGVLTFKSHASMSGGTLTLTTPLTTASLVVNVIGRVYQL